MTRSLLVTGAAAGIGRSIAEAAQRAGYHVGILDRDVDAAAAVADALGPGAIPLGADITDAASLEAALDALVATVGTGSLSGAVCNAGIVEFGPLIDLELDAWRRVVDVNLTGTFLTARAVARRLIAAGSGGSIVSVTSMNGVAPGPNAGAYGSTKAAVARLTQQMALEWGPHDIRCNAVAPGLVDAGMSEPIYADGEIRSRRSAAVPLGRLGTGDDVAGAVMFLLSDEARYITATELLVDGGVTASVISTLPRPAAVDSVGPSAAPR